MERVAIFIRKYSDDGGKTFTAGNGETPGRWLGLYVDMIPTDSDKPSAYKWSDTKGQDGTPGLPGEDGRTPYFHIKYSDNGGMSFTANNGEEPGRLHRAIHRLRAERQ